MYKRKIVFALGLFLFPIGQPTYLITTFLFSSDSAIHSLSAKEETNNANSFYKKGLKKYDQKDFKGAISDFTKAIKINSEYADAYEERGKAKDALSDFEGAISDFTKAIKINPKFGDAFYNRGLSKGELKDFKGAISDFTKAIKINPKDGDAFYNRGLSKDELKDFKGAISDYTKAIKIDPNDDNAFVEFKGDAFFNRGFLKIDLKDFKGAISDFTKAIKINPKDGDAFYNRGLSKDELKDFKGAISDYTKAIKIDPNNYDAYFNRGLARVELGDHKSGVLDINRAHEISSKNKVEISIKDIISPSMFNKRNSPMLKGYNKFAQFNGKTYQKPITYYLHDKTGKIKSKVLPKMMKDTYEISDDAEKFIVHIFSKIDSYIDLDFMRVNSPSKAMIKIFKTKPWDGNSGLMIEDLNSQKYRVEIAWSEGQFKYPKLKKYPTLSLDSAYTIVHEIAHALGLEHAGCGQYCKFNIDPYDTRINTRDTVMSYNTLLYKNNSRFLTDLDIKSLRQIWGVEKEN